MIALISVLDLITNIHNDRLLEELVLDYGLIDPSKKPIPHFSWCGAEDMDIDGAGNILQKLVASIEPFKIQTSGIGLFTGGTPVLYIPIVKNRKLLELHELIWNSVSSYLCNPNMFYSPDLWMPHITLAYQDVSQKKVVHAIKIILEDPFIFTLKVNHIAIAYAEKESSGIHRQYYFSSRGDQ